MKQILRFIVLAGLFALPVCVPFIVSSSMFFPYITGKNFTFRIVVEIIFAAWVLLALLDTQFRPRFSWILGSLALFVGVVAVADLQGINVFKSFWSNFERMEGWVTLAHVLAYFLVAGATLRTQKLWDAFWYTSLGASVLVVLMALTPIIQAISKGASIVSVPRIDGTFGNPIYLAVYALFHIFIALVLLVRWRGGGWVHNTVLGLVAFLHVAVMVLTLTRGTVLGFLGGVFVATLIIALFEKERPRLRKVAYGALVLAVLVVGSFVAIRNTEFAKTNPVLNRFTQISLGEGTIHARFMNWGVAWQGIQERPLLGYGQDNYEYVFAKHFDPNMYAEEPWFDRTHSIIFDWLIAGGFLSLIAYFLVPVAVLSHTWFLGRQKKSVWQEVRALFHARDTQFSVSERALWTGLLVAYTIHNLFVFDNLVSYLFYASVLAYIHTRVTEGRPPFYTKTMREDTWRLVALPLGIVGCIVVVWYVNVPGISTAQELITATSQNQYVSQGGGMVLNNTSVMRASFERALAYDSIGRQEVRERMAITFATMKTNKEISADTRASFGTFTLDELNKEVARNPLSPRLLLFLGSTYLEAGKVAEAEQVFTRAVVLSPEKQTSVFQLVNTKLILGKNEEARTLLKKAYESAPAYDEARTLYAIVLIRTGAYDEAKKLLLERYGTVAYDDDRFVVEWSRAKQFDVVLEILKKRVADNPNDVQKQVTLAAAYRDAGRTDEAVRVLTALIQKRPEYTTQLEVFVKQMRGW